MHTKLIAQSRFFDRDIHAVEAPTDQCQLLRIDAAYLISRRAEDQGAPCAQPI